MASGRSRADYFLAIRLTDEEIKKNYEDVRNHMVEFNSNYNNICTPKNNLHLTLCLLSIPDSAQLEAAAQALLEASEELRSQRKKTSIRLAGLSTFNGDVVYANVECSRDLYVLRSVILAFLDASNICVVDHEFTPHVTVAKVTKAFKCREGISVVDPEAYVKDKDRVFGEQVVKDVCLCRMGSERQRDGFYVTEVVILV